jgi:hypothetical protein
MHAHKPCKTSLGKATDSIAMPLHQRLPLQRLPLQPPRRRRSTPPQPSNPLANPFHNSVSARRREEAQAASHSFVLQRQVAGEQSIAARRTVDLPEPTQASRSDAAEARLTLASETAGVGAVVGLPREARISSQLWTSDVRRTPSSPPSSFVEHVDVAFLFFSLTSLLAVDINIIARIIRGERLAFLLANHSL